MQLPVVRLRWVLDHGLSITRARAPVSPRPPPPPCAQKSSSAIYEHTRPTFSLLTNYFGIYLKLLRLISFETLA